MYKLLHVQLNFNKILDKYNYKKNDKIWIAYP